MWKVIASSSRPFAHSGSSSALKGIQMAPVLAATPDVFQYLWYGLYIIGFLVIFVGMIGVLAFGKIWLKARFSGAPISFLDLFGMLVRGVNASLIAESRISAVQAGIDELSSQQLQRIYLV